MSIHYSLTSEAALKLRRQQRWSRISSIAVSLLVVVLVALVLAFFALPAWIQTSPTIVTYIAERPDDTLEPTQKTQMRAKPTPSAPSQHMSKVIAANVQSPTAVPVPEAVVESPSVDFGDGDDFGNGWSGGGGFGEGGATFFGQQVKAQRIAYVIDYSQSMRGKRDQLMREELTRSIAGLSSGMEYQLIFFAGPAWIAGDVVKITDGNRRGLVTSGRSEFEWITRGGAHGWEVKGKAQVPEWLAVSAVNSKTSLEHIKETPLVWGTVWAPGIDMALSMDPPPQIIYFMTDGLTGGNAVKEAESIAKRAKKARAIVNTVSLMEPKAREAMITLASLTGGAATLIDEKGKANVLDVK
jgi:hypothetical protein